MQLYTTWDVEVLTGNVSAVESLWYNELTKTVCQSISQLYGHACGPCIVKPSLVVTGFKKQYTEVQLVLR